MSNIKTSSRIEQIEETHMCANFNILTVFPSLSQLLMRRVEMSRTICGMNKLEHPDQQIMPDGATIAMGLVNRAIIDLFGIKTIHGFTKDESDS